MVYWGLFVSSFLAATILPVASEAVVATLIGTDYDPWICLFVATAGNSLGGLLNYGMGYLGNPKWLLKIGVTVDKLSSWEEKIKRYGIWLALFTWLPFIGDVIGVALGFFRVNFFWSMVFTVIGKFMRYAVLIYLIVFWKASF